MVVYDCPLASMEVELFSGPPTAFERAWLGEGCKAQRALRQKVHQWMLSRGQAHYPLFFYDREQSYHTLRRGVLPLLRLRAPDDENEADRLKAMLEALEPPKGGFATLKNLAGITAESISDQKISLETVFSTYLPAVQPASGPEEEVDYGSDDEPEHVGSAQAVRVPCLGILSLCLLKQTAEENDEGLEEPGPPPIFSQTDVDRALDEEASQPARIRGLRADPEEPSAAPAPLAFAAPLMRTCDAALLVTSSDAVAAATAVMTAVAPEEDAGLMAEHLGLLKPGTLVDALSQIVAASPRQRLLVCYPKSKVFLTPKGSYKVTDDDARRLLLLSWVTPLLVRYDKISEIKVKSVSREAVELSTEFKRKVILNRTVQVPESVVALMQDVSSRLSALQAAAKAAPVAAPLAAPAPAAAPSQPAAAPSQPAAAPSQPSAAGKSFKRVLEMIGEYESSLARSR
jgi:hypothetical protein